MARALKSRLGRYWNLDGGTLNLDGETLALNGETHPSAPLPYNLSTGFNYLRSKGQARNQNFAKEGLNQTCKIFW